MAFAAFRSCKLHATPFECFACPSQQCKSCELVTHALTHAFQVVSNLADYGNTSAASIPLVLDERVRDGTIKSGDVVSMWAFMLLGSSTQHLQLFNFRICVDDLHAFFS